MEPNNDTPCRLQLRAASPHDGGRTIAHLHVPLPGVPAPHRRRDQQPSALPPRPSHLRRSGHDVDPDGRLVVRSSESEAAVAAGDVVHVRLPGAHASTAARQAAGTAGTRYRRSKSAVSGAVVLLAASRKAICAALENRTLPCWIASRNVGPFEHTQPDWAAGGN